MIKKMLSVAAIAALSLMLSCEDNLRNSKESRLEELKEKVRAAGFSTEGMREYHGGYLVEGDFLMSEEAIENLEPSSHENGKTSHYIRNSTFTSGNHGVFFNSGIDLPTRLAIMDGISRYNDLDLDISFFSASDYLYAITVNGFNDPNTDVLAYVPIDQWGNVMAQLHVNTYYFNMNNNRADTKSMAAHEIGHIIGFRHTDYFSNCNGAESSADANHVTNTPTGGSANSWMNACSDGNDRPFTPQDVEALTRVCGTPLVAPGTPWIDGTNSYNGYSFEYGDVTGDGKADAVAFNVSLERAVVWAANSTGTGFISGAQWLDGPYVYNGYTFSLADVTGDGKADIVGFNPSVERAIVWVSNGTSFNSGAQWVDGPYAYSGYTTNVADVTGDGKADLIGFSASAERAIVWASTGSAFASGAQWIDGPASYNAYTFTASDMSGDGKADLVGVDAVNERVVVWKSTGTAFNSSAQWIDGPHGYSAYTFKTADMNGDGKSDLVGFNPSIERAVVWISTGTILASGKQWLGGPYQYSAYSFGVGKFNADAKADMVAVNPADERFLIWRTY
jgi:hypothetical protein